MRTPPSRTAGPGPATGMIGARCAPPRPIPRRARAAAGRAGGAVPQRFTYQEAAMFTTPSRGFGPLDAKPSSGGLRAYVTKAELIRREARPVVAAKLGWATNLNWARKSAADALRL